MLKLVTFPDYRLRQVSLPVRNIDEGLVKLVDNMLETMRTAFGIGLAAVQVGYLLRVVVVEIPSSDEWTENSDIKPDDITYCRIDYPLILVNPEIVWHSTKYKSHREGCLSIPGYSSIVMRPSKIKIRYTDLNGELRKLKASGMLAVCIQHELDHLNGKLFIDRIADEEKKRITDALTASCPQEEQWTDQREMHATQT